MYIPSGRLIINVSLLQDVECNTVCCVTLLVAKTFMNFHIVVVLCCALGCA